MHEVQADFTKSAAAAISAVLGTNDCPDSVSMGADRSAGISDSQPVLVVELGIDEVTATTKYQVTLHHMDLAATAISSGNLIASSGLITCPKKGVLCEVPMPRKHRGVLKVRITTSVANPGAGQTAKAYIMNGGNAQHVSALMPD